MRIHGGFFEKTMIFASTNHPPAPWKMPLLGLAHSSGLFEQGLAQPSAILKSFPYWSILT
jgi:hypothetical protein